jgi:hypothetical protein
MFYGWLLAVLGYNLKADESVASQFCAHLLECLGVWQKSHTQQRPRCYACACR